MKTHTHKPNARKDMCKYNKQSQTCQKKEGHKKHSETFKMSHLSRKTAIRHNPAKPKEISHCLIWRRRLETGSLSIKACC